MLLKTQLRTRVKELRQESSLGQDWLLMTVGEL